VPSGAYIIVVAYEYEKGKFIGESYGMDLSIDDLK